VAYCQRRLKETYYHYLAHGLSAVSPTAHLHNIVLSTSLVNTYIQTNVNLLPLPTPPPTGKDQCLNKLNNAISMSSVLWFELELILSALIHNWEFLTKSNLLLKFICEILMTSVLKN